MTENTNHTSVPQPATRQLAIRRTTQRRHFHFYSRCSTWTFLQNVASAPISWRREHWILGGVALLLTIMVGMVIPTLANAMRHAPTAPSLTTLQLDLPILDLEPDAEEAATRGLETAGITPLPEVDNANEWRVVRVRSGQSLADIFHQQNVSSSLLQQILDNQENAHALRHIHPGDEFAFAFTSEGQLSGLRFDRDEHIRVVLNFDDAGIKQTIQEREIERRAHVAHGVITRSLFDAGEQAGMSDAMILKLAGAFGYDIDFAQDLREGDSFTVLYEDIYREGERLRDGDIIGATFINQGKRYAAVRYTDNEGNTLFYTEDGRPLRKAFLRTPVEFTRITSGFSAGRLHPVLGTMRAHRGVDYGAPSGTPIHAAGNGKVIFRGWQNGYGNVVILQHGGHYSTLYGHMSRFVSNLNTGQHVTQGQTIGYVGMTGLATGPHLHYEFRIDGEHRDPLSVTLPKAEPLPAGEFARFKQQSQPLLAKLRTLEATQLALAK